MAKKAVPFSQAFQELEQISAWFESSEVNLDDAVKKFEQGLALAAQCKAHLLEVENKIITLKEQYPL